MRAIQGSSEQYDSGICLISAKNIPPLFAQRESDSSSESSETDHKIIIGKPGVENNYAKEESVHYEGAGNGCVESKIFPQRSSPTKPTKIQAELLSVNLSPTYLH